MKILVTGVKGQLGYDIVRIAKQQNIEVTGVDIDEMDITDVSQVNQVITDDYQAVIHCGAYTAVDKAEENQAMCFEVNGLGTKHIADRCKELDIPMMYFSTDYVFDGQGDRPWREEDERHPLNVYGQSKYEGEKYVEQLDKYFIIRISWVFGINGSNFVKTMLRLGKENDSVTVVSDQIGSPTYTYDLAKLCIKMIQTKDYGIYHATNEGYCSWYEFAQAIFKAAGMDVEVKPVDSNTYKSKAPRPKNSRMNKTKLDQHGFKRLPDWQDALKRYMKELQATLE